MNITDSREFARTVLNDTISAHQRFAGYGVTPLVDAAAAISRALETGHSVLAFGNGGSAADAQHFTAELVGRFQNERQALSAIALTTDTSALTAIGNDYGFTYVFSRQVEALGREGDVALGISTSGESPNVERALAAAKSRGLITVALTGRGGGKIGASADIHINVAESTTARIQEVHQTILHVICALLDRALETR